MDDQGFIDREVAVAVSGGDFQFDRSTICRVRRGRNDPSAILLLRLNRWAARVARKRRLRVDDRLGWDHIDPTAP